MVQIFLADYRKQLKNNGCIAAYHLMGQPIKVEGSVVTISLINPVQVELLQSLKEELLPAIRKKLSHPTVNVQGILVNQIVPDKPYTDQEKLSYLSKKNSAIALLQERFMLEVVY
ncbi:hypothetical protein ACRRVA_01455 [Candidatus Cardinium hertigii]|uniref:hypothetical protein n=1 Tax=Candidatus Cardinium hertigii TaxID=247481 RepID=UPI003D7DECA6